MPDLPTLNRLYRCLISIGFTKNDTSENIECVYSNNVNMKHDYYNTPERPFHTAGTFLNALFRIVDCLSEHFKAGVKVPRIKGAENQLWKGNAEQTAFHVLLP